jgi:hypothetical protein
VQRPHVLRGYDEDLAGLCRQMFAKQGQSAALDNAGIPVLPRNDFIYRHNHVVTWLLSNPTPLQSCSGVTTWL